jgi:UDP-N-acetylmuramate dehydrogenase
MKNSTIHSNVSLKKFNTFGIDAKARYYAEAQSIEDLPTILNSTQAKNTPHFILGGGSNVLFTQDLDSLVIRILMSGIKIIKEDDDHVWIQIGAGENWHQLVLHCVENNWGGVENLSLIPGTVGAAPVQNIGAYGVELKDIFSELQAFHIDDQSLHIFKHSDCHFGYRDSIFKNSHKNQYIICSITLRLDKKPNFHLSYKAVAETLQKTNGDKITLRAVSNAIIDIRRSKLPDPNEIGNAGSFFKNPEIMLAQFNQLQSQYPDIPHYATASDKVKIPAGWLIEQCGWKGKRSGNIGVYPKQALVLVNYGNATGQEIKQLAEQIKLSVYEKFNIDLLMEVNIL